MLSQAAVLGGVRVPPPRGGLISSGSEVILCCKLLYLGLLERIWVGILIERWGCSGRGAGD